MWFHGHHLAYCAVQIHAHCLGRTAFIGTDSVKACIGLQKKRMFTWQPASQAPWNTAKLTYEWTYMRFHWIWLALAADKLIVQFKNGDGCKALSWDTPNAFHNGKGLGGNYISGQWIWTFCPEFLSCSLRAALSLASFYIFLILPSLSLCAHLTRHQRFHPPQEIRHPCYRPGFASPRSS